VDVIMEALSNFKGDRSFWEVHIAGGVGEMCQDILGLPSKLGIGSNVKFHGRLSDERFKKLLSEMDLLISLRYPTMGETSGVVTRALQMGIPVIVNDIGWYSELPDFADKVSVEDMQCELLALFEKYLFDRNYLKEKKKVFTIYSQTKLDFNKVVKDFFNVLMREHQKKCGHRPAENQKLIEMVSLPLSDLDLCEDFFLERIITKLDIILS